MNIYDERADWGKLIQQKRKSLGLRQDDLASGICTPSYLSRIENGLATAEERIYELLLERLGLDLSEEQKNKTSTRSFLEQMYRKLLSNEELFPADIEQLASYQHASFHQQESILGFLVYARYVSSAGRPDEAVKLLRKAEPFITWQQDRNTQVYIAVSAYVELSLSEFIGITEREENYHLTNCLRSTDKFEQANYYYHLAFAYHRQYTFYLALKFIEHAETVFTHVYKPLFRLKLYSLKGVILNDLHRYEDAMAEYEAGRELLREVPSIQTPEQWSSLLNNMGFCYECQERFDEASSHYQAAVEYKQDLHIVVNWMRVSFRQGDLIRQEELLEQFPLAYFTNLQHRYQIQLLSAAREIDSSVTDLWTLEEEIYPYFEEKEYFELILFYAPLWAELYRQRHAYKRAYSCMRRAFVASERVRSRQGQ